MTTSSELARPPSNPSPNPTAMVAANSPNRRSTPAASAASAPA